MSSSARTPVGAAADHAPENLAVPRRLALNIVQTHPARIPMRHKLRRAAWDDAFPFDLLGHMR
jgi:hypothetical protein